MSHSFRRSSASPAADALSTGGHPTSIAAAAAAARARATRASQRAPPSTAVPRASPAKGCPIDDRQRSISCGRCSIDGRPSSIPCARCSIDSGQCIEHPLRSMAPSTAIHRASTTRDALSTAIDGASPAKGCSIARQFIEYRRQKDGRSIKLSTGPSPPKPDFSTGSAPA